MRGENEGIRRRRGKIGDETTRMEELRYGYVVGGEGGKRDSSQYRSCRSFCQSRCPVTTPKEVDHEGDLPLT